MALQPVEATLIVGTAGVLATTLTTTSAVLITHRLTLHRDRQHRVWDRRMDTYQEVLRARRAFAEYRQDVLHAQSTNSGTLDSEKELNAFLLTQAQLDMFGSPATTILDTLSLAAFNNWTRVLLEWRDLHTRAKSHFNNQEMWDEAEQKWAELKEASKIVDLADRRLVEVIRHEAKFKEFPRPTRRQRVIPRLQRLRSWRRHIKRDETAPSTPTKEASSRDATGGRMGHKLQ